MAVMWFTKAANQGHARAQYNLRLMYDQDREALSDDAFQRARENYVTLKLDKALNWLIRHQDRFICKYHLLMAQHQFAQLLNEDLNQVVDALCRDNLIPDDELDRYLRQVRDHDQSTHNFLNRLRSKNIIHLDNNHQQKVAYHLAKYIYEHLKTTESLNEAATLYGMITDENNEYYSEAQKELAHIYYCLSQECAKKAAQRLTKDDPILAQLLTTGFSPQAESSAGQSSPSPATSTSTPSM